MRIRLSLLLAAVLITVAVRAAAPATSVPHEAVTPVAVLDVDHLPVGAMLSWTCVSGEVAGFDVERSLDGLTFEIISRVAAERAVTEAYNYLDTERPAARAYYRITSFDRFGNSAHSPLAEAPVADPAGWYLNGAYGDGSETEFAFEIEAMGMEMLACELLDLTGQSVLRRELLVQPGPNRLTIPVAGLDAGAYTLLVSGADLTEALNFLKAAAPASDFQTMVRGN